MTGAAATEFEESDASYEIVDPDASALVESLRAFGYTPGTAVADLIDNSITAGAKNVWIYLHWSGRESFVALVDDGSGMSEQKLVEAMRPGTQNPMEERDLRDLGRFGLGLKTASFSQCRRLTVQTRRSQGPTALRCWDLDYVGETGEWRLLKTVQTNTLKRISRAMQAGGEGSGTVVLWECLDRITGDADTEDPKAHKQFFEVIDEIRDHLAMVFHHYLQYGNLRIQINDRQVDPWDPFMTREAATQMLPKEILALRGSSIFVQPYVLPHVSKLASEAHRNGAGPNGWNGQQGFYVYRNNRLLVAGDWLGLGFRKEEHCKLARIRIDFPNNLDADWIIDVKKSKAQPPRPLKDRLKQIAKMTREKAIAVYRHRGKVVARKTSPLGTFLWQKRVKFGKISYTINRDHPVYKAMDLPSEVRQNVEAFLRLVEESLPIPLIVLDSAEQPDTHARPLESMGAEETLAMMRTAMESLENAGMSPSDACKTLYTIEPFMYSEELLAVLLEEVEEHA